MTRKANVDNAAYLLMSACVGAVVGGVLCGILCAFIQHDMALDADGRDALVFHVPQQALGAGFAGALAVGLIAILVCAGYLCWVRRREAATHLSPQNGVA